MLDCTEPNSWKFIPSRFELYRSERMKISILCQVVDGERPNYPPEEAEEYVLFSFLSFFRSYEGSFLFARDHCMVLGGT